MRGVPGLMNRGVCRQIATLVLGSALLSGCASAEGRELARGLLEGMAEASSTMAAMKGGKYAQYAPITQAAAQMFEPIPDLPPFQEEPEIHLGEMPGAITAVSGDPYSGDRYPSSGNWDVQGIVNRLAVASGLPAYLVNIDQKREENAFADGARIIVTQGLLRATASEDELALVLGHEIAHNVLRHPQSQPDYERVVEIGQGIASGLRGIGTNTRLAIDGFAGAIKGARTRPQEREADRLGTEIAFKAGYDPIRGTSFFQRSMARNAEVSRHISNLQNNAALWERYLGNARNARAREEGYQERARSSMEQARANRDRAAAIHSRVRTVHSSNQYVRFENHYLSQVGVFQQAWNRYQRAAQNEVAAQANFNASRVNFDRSKKTHLLGLVPFVRTHPVDSERIQDIVALTHQLRSGGGDVRVASTPGGVPTAGGSMGKPLAATVATTAMRQHTAQVAPLEPMSTGPAEAVAVVLPEADAGRDAGLPPMAEADARPEQEAFPAHAHTGRSAAVARAVAEEGAATASKADQLPRKLFIRGLRTSQEISFGETGSVNIWSISGAVVNPTGRPMKQARLRAIFYDGAGEEVHKEERTVSFQSGVAEAPLSWNVKGVALRAQQVEVTIVGIDAIEREKPKTAKKAKRST